MDVNKIKHPLSRMLSVVQKGQLWATRQMRTEARITTFSPDNTNGRIKSK